MPKILYLTDGLFNGGAERQLALILKYLPSGWARRVFSLGDGPFTEAIRASGIPVEIRERKARFDARPALHVWHSIREWKPDLIHSWGWMGSVAAGPMCKALGIPFIDGTIRMGKKPPRNRLAQRLGMAWADRIVANSQAGLKAWGIGPGKGRVVYNGFDPDRLRLCYGNKQWSDSPIKVVMTGSMAKRKDYSTFLDAARWLINKGKRDWQFVAIGDGPDRDKLMASVGELMSAGQVQFPASSLEVLPQVNQSHIGVLMSHPTYHAEGCSNSILEYMACGLPVVCNDMGGNRELVVEGETGYLIPPGNSSALVDRILMLRTTPREGERLGQAGRQQLLAHFSVERMILALLRVYDEVL
jgi:glycosyltransferase involved in cell wall biosynthesis